VFGGQVFTELSTQMHACEPFDIPPEWERFMVLDWGFAKPFSVGWYAVDYDDNLYRYREWYGNKEGEHDMGVRMIARDVARGILDREEPDRAAGARIRTRYGDSSIRDNRPAFRRGESIARTIHEDLVNEGVFCLETDRDRLQGKMQVHARLRAREVVDHATGEIITEQPSVRIFSDHRHFWRTVPSLQYDEKHVEDVDTKAEDHIYDEFRYACMARQMKPRKVETVPHGSFARERSRMIRARKLAARTGIPFDAAYRKTR